jgi:hypothetical protein
MPVRFDDPAKLFSAGDPADPQGFDMDMAMDALREAGMEDDEYELRLRAVAMHRALQDALRP